MPPLKPNRATAQAQANPLLVVQQFTVDDLNAAIADANAQTPPDTVADGCYQALLPIVQGGVANPLPASPGVFQAMQKARDAQALIANMQSPTGPLAGVNAACAPLVLPGAEYAGAARHHDRRGGREGRADAADCAAVTSGAGADTAVTS